MEKALYSLLSELCGEERILTDPSVELLESGLLDSFGLVCLLETLEDRYNLEIHPTQYPRSAFATPAAIWTLVQAALEEQ